MRYSSREMMVECPRVLGNADRTATSKSARTLPAMSEGLRSGQRSGDAAIPGRVALGLKGTEPKHNVGRATPAARRGRSAGATIRTLLPLASKAPRMRLAEQINIVEPSHNQLLPLVGVSRHLATNRPRSGGVVGADGAALRSTQGGQLMLCGISRRDWLCYCLPGAASIAIWAWAMITLVTTVGQP